MIPPSKLPFTGDFTLPCLMIYQNNQRVPIGIFPKLPAAQSLGAKGQNPAEHPRSVSGTCCVRARLVACLHASCFHYPFIVMFQDYYSASASIFTFFLATFITLHCITSHYTTVHCHAYMHSTSLHKLHTYDSVRTDTYVIDQNWS